MSIPRHAPPAAFLAEVQRRFIILNGEVADSPEAPAASDRRRRDNFERAISQAVSSAANYDRETGWFSGATIAPIRKGALPTVAHYSIWCDGTTIDSPTGTAADFIARWNAIVDAEIISETDRLTALRIG